MSLDIVGRVGSIRMEHPGERSVPTKRLELAAPAFIERAFITHESSVRADLVDVEAVDAGLEIHDQSSCFDDKHANDEGLTQATFVYKR